MIGTRTLYSIAQYLELQDGKLIALLLEKHGLDAADVSDAIECGTSLLTALVDALNAAAEPQVSSLLEEVFRTSRDLYSRVRSGRRYDERFDDLKRCLQLDGYLVEGGKLIPVDPFIVDSPPVEDDLTRELEGSGLPKCSDVLRKLSDSTDAFRASTPDYNASLNNARVALETLAIVIAEARLPAHPGSVGCHKWGSVIAYFRSTDFITVEEECGLVGVFRFVSPGSHRPVGLSEEEFARLGRGFVAGMCWFLVKKYRARR